MIKVLIVDDMKILRECLKMVINQDADLEVIGDANHGKEAVEMSRINRPDVILMDLNMPVYSGYDAIKDIKKDDPTIKILVLSVETEEQNITTAFANGADGYVLKDITPEELAIVIKKAFHGEKYVHECGFSMGQKVINLNQKNLEESEYFKIDFTEREKEVIYLVMEGMTNEEIAEELGISTGRARNIVADLISKCMVKNRTQLAVIIAKTQMIIHKNK